MSKWLKGLLGCGCGCLVLVIAFFGGSAIWVKNMTGTFDEAVATAESLESMLDTPETFVPPPGPELPADRLETFLRVREATQEARLAVASFTEMIDEEKIEALEDEGGWEQFKTAMGMVRGSVGFGQDLANFFAVRNRALLDEQMGFGEYAYYYALVYCSWFGERFEQVSGEIDMGTAAGAAKVAEWTAGMLERQLETLPADAPASWREALMTEVERLRANDRRVAWDDGLPLATIDSLAPHRERLKELFAPSIHGMELARTEKNGDFSFSTEF